MAKSNFLKVMAMGPIRPPGVAEAAQATPDVSTPVETSPVETLSGLPIHLLVQRSRKRLFRPRRPSEAHTDGEDRLYKFMWENGAKHAPSVRLFAGSITVMARHLGRDDRNTRPLLQSLTQKLSIQLAQEVDFKAGKPRAYYVFDYTEISARRKRAGLEWALKNKGIQLITAAEAALHAQRTEVSTPVETSPVETSWPEVSTPVRTIVSTPVETPRLPYGEFSLEKDRPTTLRPTSVITAVLQRYLGERPDDDGIAALVSKCHAAAPDATDDEIAHFVDLKADQAIRMRTVRNLMGFLLTAAPRSLTPAALADLRDRRARQLEAARREEEERQAQFNELVAEQRDVLANPSATEEDRLFAVRFLENVGQT